MMSKMINIQRAKFYLLYNVDISDLLEEQKLIHEGLSSDQFQLLEKRGFSVHEKKAAGYFTKYYREEHTPFTVMLNQTTETFIDLSKMVEFPFYKDLKLNMLKIGVKFDIELIRTGIGLISICIDIDETVEDYDQLYRIGCLYLNQKYKVISTESISYLFELHKENGIPRPEFITPDELASLIFDYTFRDLKKRERFKALSHEIQIPVISLDIKVDNINQKAFIEQNKDLIASFVFRPKCWEVNKMSESFIDKVVSESRMWSVAENNFVVASYEGCIIINLKEEGKSDVKTVVSGFDIAGETSILQTYHLVISNYHELRIVDDALDGKNKEILKAILSFQNIEGDSWEKAFAIEEVSRFLNSIMNFRYVVNNLLEGISNSDKLIDEEYHIELFNVVANVLGLEIWLQSVNNRMKELTNLLQSVENTQETLMALEQSKSANALGYVQIFALAEVVFSFIGVTIIFLLPDESYIKKIIDSLGIYGILLFFILFPVVIVYFFYSFLNWFSNRKLNKFQKSFRSKFEANKLE